MGKHTAAALNKLLAHLEEMTEVVQLAMTGNAEAIDAVTENCGEFCGQYTTLRRLAGNVQQGCQWDDDEQAEIEYQKELEREEARRCCGP